MNMSDPCISSGEHFDGARLFFDRLWLRTIREKHQWVLLHSRDDIIISYSITTTDNYLQWK